MEISLTVYKCPADWEYSKYRQDFILKYIISRECLRIIYFTKH